jgi:hypothetical protein
MPTAGFEPAIPLLSRIRRITERAVSAWIRRNTLKTDIQTDNRCHIIIVTLLLLLLLLLLFLAMMWAYGSLQRPRKLLCPQNSLIYIQECRFYFTQ